jgi:peptidoglycan hydrolase CwlO-like protein
MELQDHIYELEKQIDKLVSSNDELQAFFDETQEAEYAEAIEENKGVIARKRDQVAQLRAVLAKAGNAAQYRGPLPDNDDEDDMADVIDMTARK